MRTLKLMADYGCFPLWKTAPGQTGNVDPGSLPISEKLRLELNQWSDLFDQTLNQEDPTSSSFESDEEERTFKAKGSDLGKRLQAELGPEVKVIVSV